MIFKEGVDMKKEEQISRWRLILGSETNDSFEAMGGGQLSKEEMLMDSALSAIYGNSNESFDNTSSRGAGRGPSSPVISKWLGDLRSLFDQEIVAEIGRAHV